jgi:hypothetical protein
MKTLKASLIGSFIGTAAWLRGLTQQMWPAHPGWTVFLVTMGATVLLTFVLAEPQK